MDYGKFDPSVNRKRLKDIGKPSSIYIITLQSRVAVQNLAKKSVNPFSQASREMSAWIRTLCDLRREILVDRLFPVDGETFRHQEVVDRVKHVTFDVTQSLTAVF